MVFTLVTIIFLPMSFMAAFFAINIIEFPHDPQNGGNGLHLSYVAKYMFGIGFGVSVPLIMLAFVMSDTEGWMWSLKNWVGRKRMPKQQQVIMQEETQRELQEVEKARASVEAWRYRRPTRVDTGGTDRSRKSHDAELASPV
jgi:hypothetical protein